MSNKRFRHDAIAIVYDFDGTLSPQPMQEYTVLPQIGIAPTKFWKDVKQEAKETESEEMLVYTRLLLEKADAKKVNIGKKEFKALAGKIIYFNGVERWFSRMNKYVRRRGAGKIKVRHYLISAGVREILEDV